VKRVIALTSVASLVQSSLMLILTMRILLPMIQLVWTGLTVGSAMLVMVTLASIMVLVVVIGKKRHLQAVMTGIRVLQPLNLLGKIKPATVC
jgi:hypothetical protein